METISKYYKAMLDTLAYTEGTLGMSQNGYDLLFGSYTINGWDNNIEFGHQGDKWLVKAGTYSTTAAGRYQFLAGTWLEKSKKEADTLGLKKLEKPIIFKGDEYYYNAPFTSKNQDYFGYKLIKSKVSESELIKAEKSANDFSLMIQNNKLDCTWTSLARALSSTAKPCFGQAKPGSVKHKEICQPNGCSSGAEEIWSIYKKALSSY